jgi:hypothetical protein
MAEISISIGGKQKPRSHVNAAVQEEATVLKGVPQRERGVVGVKIARRGGSYE